MSDTETVPDVRTDRAFQERFWFAVRIGWVLMLAIFVAALFGLTGSGGYFADRTLLAEGAKVTLPAVSRWASSDSMTIEISQSVRNGATVVVPSSLGDMFSIEAINPEPVQVRSVAGGEHFTFAVAPDSGSHSIDFAIRAVKPGWQHRLGSFEINGAKTAETSVTVLP